jgi:hypothetical protein
MTESPCLCTDMEWVWGDFIKCFNCGKRYSSPEEANELRDKAEDDEPICACGHDAGLHPSRMMGRKLQPRGKCYAVSGCSCTTYQSAFADIDPGIHRYVNSQGFTIKQEDVEPSWKPSLTQQMEDLHMHAYLQKQHEDLEVKCGKDIADMMYIDTDKCYISGCTCGKPKYDRESEDDVDPKVTDPNEKLNLSDWDKLNNEVAWLTNKVGDLTAQLDVVATRRMIGPLRDTVAKHDKSIEDLKELVDSIILTNRLTSGDLNKRVGELEEVLPKTVDTLETQLGSIRDLHDTAKTQNSIIVSLQKRVTSLEAKYATNYIHVKDTPIYVKDTPISNISVNVPPTVPHKDNTSKLLLKRFLAVQRICEASIDLDKHGAVAPSTDRQWLAQSVLNILNGNVDG